MSQNPQAVWNNALACGQFNTDAPVTVPTTPQGVSQIVEVVPKQVWDIVLSESAKAPNAIDCHVELSFSDNIGSPVAPPIFRVQQPSPASYGGLQAVRVTAIDSTTGLQRDALGRMHFRIYRTGPLSG